MFCFDFDLITSTQQTSGDGTQLSQRVLAGIITVACFIAGTLLVIFYLLYRRRETPRHHSPRHGHGTESKSEPPALRLQLRSASATSFVSPSIVRTSRDGSYIRPYQTSYSSQRAHGDEPNPNTSSLWANATDGHDMVTLGSWLAYQPPKAGTDARSSTLLPPHVALETFN